MTFDFFVNASMPIQYHLKFWIDDADMKIEANYATCKDACIYWHYFTVIDVNRCFWRFDLERSNRFRARHMQLKVVYCFI